MIFPLILEHLITILRANNATRRAMIDFADHQSRSNDYVQALTDVNISGEHSLCCRHLESVEQGSWI